MKFTLCLLLVLVCFSCKEDKGKSEENSALATSKVKDDTFKVILNIKILEDDKIELYYLGEFANGNFNSEERVAKFIKGKSEFQTIELTLPKDVIPYKFRIDIGDNINKNQTQVDIKSINLILNENSINIDHTLLGSFFQSNMYLEKNNSGYLRKAVDNKYDPFIQAKPVLIKKIELEL